MPVMATPKKFAMQGVFEILLRSASDKSLLAYLSDCKTSSLENTVEMTYPTGKTTAAFIKLNENIMNCWKYLIHKYTMR